MQKNAALAAALFASLSAFGCADPLEGGPEPFQGVVELDSGTFGFDLAGRLATVDVAEGDVVKMGDKLASLDDAMALLARDMRAADLAAAEAQLSLLQAGSRPEEVRATSAELDAAKTQEKLAEQMLARQAQLVQSGVVGSATVDELDAQLARSRGQRRALSERLSALRGGARSQEIETAQARVTAAKAGLAVENERLARHALFAARAGTVTDVFPERGEVVGAGSPILSIADAERPYVDIFVPQDHIGEVRLGGAMKVHTDAHPEPLSGRVEHIGSRLEFTPRFLFSERERPNLVLRVRVRLDAAAPGVPAGVPAFVSPADAS